MSLPEPLRLTDTDVEQALSVYQHLHANPELSMQEHATAEYITEQLAPIEGLEHFRCGGTGVVAVLRNGEGPAVAFRADTDGLPIAEETGVDYASTVVRTAPGGENTPAMHACAHDLHTTSALTALRLLVRDRDSWSGTVVFVFQPGEETGAGSVAMVEDGLWDRAPRPVALLGQHVFPYPVGTVVYVPGPAMTNADNFRITFHGRGGHGSSPEAAIDPILLASHAVTRLHTIVSREVGALDSAVLTVGMFHAGTKENIIPDDAWITVNVRSYVEPVRERVLTAIRRVVEGEAATAGAPPPTIERLSYTPALVNDPDEITAVMGSIAAELGPENVHETTPLMSSEDCGVLAHAAGVPLVYWWTGGFSGDPTGYPAPHSPTYLPEPGPTLRTAVRATLAGLLHYVGR